ncbi:DUF4089 domain-containing protein [Oricola sp.]|uniref:DUF4089 domain-containing protein n=1 Tax=Oricola sp. TaxID=1979950 RepID=UPI000C94BB1E|nr:DUF4089 domain-containing protein [Ahrensia sp.]|tara:strand:+ start:13637 stop:13825 length:189 start_codon:yes stop_codon:yes gene_type:complete
MSGEAFDAKKLIEAMAEFLGLPLEDEYREGITAHLIVAHSIAQGVLAFETSDDAEPAPVFEP